jgi:hypothetical protein
MSLSTVATAILLAAASSGALQAAADAAAAPGANAVILEINGTKLTAADMEKKQAAALFQAQTNYYEAQRRVIEGMIDDYLLEQQAHKEGVTVQQLLERHVDANIAKDPSEETLRVYFEGVDTAEPYEAVRIRLSTRSVSGGSPRQKRRMSNLCATNRRLFFDCLLRALRSR